MRPACWRFSTLPPLESGSKLRALQTLREGCTLPANRRNYCGARAQFGRAHSFASLQLRAFALSLLRFAVVPVCLLGWALQAVEPWQAVIAQMPLRTNVTELNRTNCVGIMLNALQSNDVVKALVFMPGATDEFYFFRRARAELTKNEPSLLDAVSALTNQTRISATFRPPFLLLHTAEDFLTPVAKVEHEPTAEKIRKARFVPHGVYNDRDWDSMRSVLKRAIGVDLHPWPRLMDSWHFYRHSFAAWNLSGWEALEATALAGETSFTVKRKQVVYEMDPRPRVAPKTETAPR